MKFTSSVPPLGLAICSVLLAGCATPTLPGSPGHVTEAARVPGRIPEPVLDQAPLPAPRPTPKLETYSVTVHKVPAQSLLFALARDAGLNVDVHPGIEGTVTLNALDQTLPQLLERIARQVDMRYELNGSTLTVMPDTPVWRNYKVDYVNMARSTNSSVNIATQISTTGGGSNTTSVTNANGTTSGGVAPSGGSGNNNSTTSVVNRSDNNFWSSLEKNIRDMLRETTLNDAPTTIKAQQPEPAQQQTGQAAQGQQPSATAAPQPTPDNVLAAFGASRGERERNLPSVVVNAEGGLLAVRATGRQHEKIRQFLDMVVGSAKRQVLIEATVIEVRLSDQYQQGINWSGLGSKFSLSQRQVGPNALSSGVQVGTSPGIFSLSYVNPTSALGNISSAIQLLESFGKVKVLSSPKISVLNNQTAMLKVVDNNVFFSIKVTPAVIGPNGTTTAPATYESKLETVPVGFVMSVTPQIADTDEVTLNVRPTITRIVGYVQDPNPALADANVISRVPVIQAREIESILKVYSGDISVLGGLMQDSVDNAKDAIPGTSRLPFFGKLFSYRNEQVSKTELVIFIRPVVVKNASINGDYKDYRYLLPDGAPAPAYAEPPKVN